MGRYTLSDFQYELPKRLIAQEPARERTGSRLMAVDRAAGRIAHLRFEDLKGFARKGDCFVFNDTKVMPARLIGEKLAGAGAVTAAAGAARVNAAAAAGARVEALLIRRTEDPFVWEALVRPGRRLKNGDAASFGGGLLRAAVAGVLEGGSRLLRFGESGAEFDRLLEAAGRIPLPPYIKNERVDLSRYQTVYSKFPGSAAAPTAGLHFTGEYIGELEKAGAEAAYVTLHVGPGTFRPVKTENIEEHSMHGEHYRIGREAADAINRAKSARERILAAGRAGHGAAYAQTRAMAMVAAPEPAAVEPARMATATPAHMAATAQAPVSAAAAPVSSATAPASAPAPVSAAAAPASAPAPAAAATPARVAAPAQAPAAAEKLLPRTVCVGTTSLRTLESASGELGYVEPREGWTDIFIYPGYAFKCADALLTNFHLPGSTLLMLVCAFAGYELAMEAYRQAVAEEYRFFSFGDAMFIGDHIL